MLLQIEVEPERLEKAMDQAYRRVSSRARIPGFRPGKAPRTLVERFLGHETLLQEALDHLVPEVYKEALEQEGIEPVDQADFEFPQLEPVIVKATVPIRPRIDLGDLSDLRLEREDVQVDEQVVADTLEQLRHRYATVEPVERPVQEGDILRASLRATVDGRVIFEQRDAEFTASAAETAGLPGLAEHVVGTERGASAEFSVDVPEAAESEGTEAAEATEAQATELGDAQPEASEQADVPRRPFAGQTINYSVQIHEIKQEELPELNDEFAQQVGEGFPTLDALRERLRNDSRSQAEEEAKHRYEQKALDALVARATLEYPSVLVDREIDSLIRERVPDGGQRQAIQRYLAAVGKSEEELREELRPLATVRLIRALVLSQLAENEGVSVSSEEVDEEIERLGAQSGAAGEQLRDLFGGDTGRRVLERTLLTRKSYDRIAEIASGEAAPRQSQGGAAEPGGATGEEPSVSGAKADTAVEETTLPEDRSGAAEVETDASNMLEPSAEVAGSDGGGAEKEQEPTA